MKHWLKSIRPIFVCLLTMTILCGVIYTALVTGIAKTIFPEKANGSIVSVTLKDGTVKEYGSALIAQEFKKPEYLIGRPIGTTNLSPISAEQNALVQQRIAWLHSLDPENKKDIPMDLVTASGSGVDPYISPEAAYYQAPRIAKARNMSEDNVISILKQYTVSKFLGIWGESGVNVLKVNLALDRLI